jgi:thiamine pyrophosphate-dependent acetolactate synthase large subunit-like protein
MERIDCLKVLVPFIKDDLVIVSLGRTADEWDSVCHRDGNLFAVGMGHHIPLGLGLASVLPHRRVIVLDTDGSVLMLLSALTTLGVRPAKNLKIFVFDNEAYEGTGGQPSATAEVADIAGAAQVCGVTGAKTVHDLETFQAAVREALTTQGLTFIVAKVELAKGAAPQRKTGYKESLLRFVRFVETTENINILHGQHT